jgi:hypothetical protein
MTARQSRQTGSEKCRVPRIEIFGAKLLKLDPAEQRDDLNRSKLAIPLERLWREICRVVEIGGDVIADRCVCRIRQRSIGGGSHKLGKLALSILAAPSHCYEAAMALARDTL